MFVASVEAVNGTSQAFLPVSLSWNVGHPDIKRGLEMKIGFDEVAMATNAELHNEIQMQVPRQKKHNATQL